MLIFTAIGDGGNIFRPIAAYKRKDRRRKELLGQNTVKLKEK